MNSRGLINEMVFNWGKSWCVLGDPHLSINWREPKAIIWSHTASTWLWSRQDIPGSSGSPMMLHSHNGQHTSLPVLCFSFPSYFCRFNVRVKSLEDLWALMNWATVAGLAELWYYTPAINGAFCLHSLIESVFKCSLTSCEMMHSHSGAPSPSEDFLKATVVIRQSCSQVQRNGKEKE